MNRIQEDSNAPESQESTRESYRGAFIVGYRMGGGVGLELHAGLPYASISFVVRF